MRDRSDSGSETVIAEEKNTKGSVYRVERHVAQMGRSEQRFFLKHGTRIKRSRRSILACRRREKRREGIEVWGGQYRTTPRHKMCEG